MSRHCCIVGGGATLAQPLIAKWLIEGQRVTMLTREPLSGKYAALRQNVSDGANDVDLLVTMTGKSLNGKLVNLDKDDWDEVIEASLGAVASALANVGLNDGANVVVVGSIVGSTGGYGCAAYAAAKAGLVGLVRAAANEWASRGICVNLLELGYCNAGMGARLDPKVRERALASIPLKRFAEPHEVVDAVEWLGRVRYMTGNVLTLAGGMR